MNLIHTSLRSHFTSAVLLTAHKFTHRLPANKKQACIHYSHISDSGLLTGPIPTSALKSKENLLQSLLQFSFVIVRPYTSSQVTMSAMPRTTAENAKFNATLSQLHTKHRISSLKEKAISQQMFQPSSNTIRTTGHSLEHLTTLTLHQLRNYTNLISRI